LSRDPWWRYVTLKGQGRDSVTSEPYLEIL